MSIFHATRVTIYSACICYLFSVLAVSHAEVTSSSKEQMPIQEISPGQNIKFFLEKPPLQLLTNLFSAPQNFGTVAHKIPCLAMHQESVTCIFPISFPKISEPQKSVKLTTSPARLLPPIAQFSSKNPLSLSSKAQRFSHMLPLNRYPIYTNLPLDDRKPFTEDLSPSSFESEFPTLFCNIQSRLTPMKMRHEESCLINCSSRSINHHLPLSFSMYPAAPDRPAYRAIHPKVLPSFTKIAYEKICPPISKADFHLSSRIKRQTIGFCIASESEKLDLPYAMATYTNKIVPRLTKARLPLPPLVLQSTPSDSDNLLLCQETLTKNCLPSLIDFSPLHHENTTIRFTDQPDLSTLSNDICLASPRKKASLFCRVVAECHAYEIHDRLPSRISPCEERYDRPNVEKIEQFPKNTATAQLHFICLNFKEHSLPVLQKTLPQYFLTPQAILFSPLAERSNLFSLPARANHLAKTFDEISFSKERNVDLASILSWPKLNSFSTAPDFFFIDPHLIVNIDEAVPRKIYKPTVSQSLIAVTAALKFPYQQFLSLNDGYRIKLPMMASTNDISDKYAVKKHMYDTLQRLTLPKMKTRVSPYLPARSTVPLHDFTPKVKQRLKGKILSEHEKMQVAQNFALVPQLADLDTISYRDEFSVQSEIMSEAAQEGYIFSVSLKPLAYADISTQKQNIVFLIDRSGCIEPHRFNIFRKAVEKSLNYLSPEDTFNIVFFDSKTSQLNRQPLEINEQTISSAKNYLRLHQNAAFFTEGDIYRALQEIINQTPHDRHTSIILLSNGKKLKNLQKNNKELANLLSHNPGCFSVYTAATGSGNHLPMLECLSKLHHGQLMYSSTFAAFPRKLALLVKDLRNPIANKVRVHATGISSLAKIALFPAPSNLPPIYRDQTYTFYGVMHHIEDFHLCVQGKIGNRWVNISKPISPVKISKGNGQLARHFMENKIYTLYDQYLATFDPSTLVEIQKLSHPLKMPVPL